MPQPPATLHIAHRARRHAVEVRTTVVETLVLLERSRALLTQPIYPPPRLVRESAGD